MGENPTPAVRPVIDVESAKAELYTLGYNEYKDVDSDSWDDIDKINALDGYKSGFRFSNTVVPEAARMAGMTDHETKDSTFRPLGVNFWSQKLPMSDGPVGELYETAYIFSELFDAFDAGAHHAMDGKDRQRHI